MKRAGYAFRQVYQQFLYRYKMLANETWPHWEGNPQEGVRIILTNQEIPEDEYAFGKSKIFIRNPKMVSAVIFLNFETDRFGRTVQTQIRLLLQSDQGLHCLHSILPSYAILFRFL